MSSKKIPYHLRIGIEEIVSEARKHIQVSYVQNTIRNTGMGCQVRDFNDYGVFFFEPKKFFIPSGINTQSLDQRSSHQNAIIALKKWEQELRAFLINPPKMDMSEQREEIAEEAGVIE